MNLQSLITENCHTFDGIARGRIGTIEVSGNAYDVNYLDNGTVKELLSTGFGKAPATQEILDQIITRLEASGGKFIPASR